MAMANAEEVKVAAPELVVDRRAAAPYESSSSPATEQRMQGGNMK